jgi:hypothetical protein
MKLMIIVFACPLIFALAAEAQDQDSLIIGTVYVDSGQAEVFLPVMGITFDSVGGYYLRIRCSAPLGGVSISPEIFYFPPLTEWDALYDSIYSDMQNVVMHGIADMPGGGEPSPIFTAGLRDSLWMFRLLIDPDVSPQVVVIDTIDNLSFGNNPFFVPGHVYIGIPADVYGGSERLPQNASLSRNYPNPFNDRTTINYSLPEAYPVRLDVHNVLGQKVVTLHDGMQEAGEHKVIWDAREMPSGVYFYRLTAPGYTDTKKMTLLK